MTELLIYLGVSVGAMLMFIARDAYAAYDDDPNTHTVSMYLKRWGRQAPAHRFLLGFVVFQLCLAPLYLFGHLVLEIW